MTATYTPATLTGIALGAPANAATWNVSYAQVLSNFNDGTKDFFPRQVVVSMTTGEDITAGDYVRISGATILKATNASSAGISKTLGFAAETKTTGNACKVSVNSVYGLSSLTAGAFYYVGVDGAITTTRPASNAKIIGIATSTTDILIISGTEEDATFSTVTVSGTVTANLFSGSGASLTTLNASNLSSGTVPSARVSGAYSGITGLGTLTALQVDNLNLDGNTLSTTSGALNLTPLSGQGLNITLGTTGDLAVNTNQLFVDTSTGFVGIGTASPFYKLDLGMQTSNHALTWNGVNNIYSTFSTAALVIGSNIRPGGSSNTYQTGFTGTQGAVAIRLGLIDGTGNSGLIRFFADLATSKTAGDPFIPTERMRIDGTGNVGIGTDAPTTLLSVNGVASFGAGTAALPSIAAFGDLNTGAWFPAADTFAVSTGGSERLRIASGGHLLIGTSGTRAVSVAVMGSGGPQAVKVLQENIDATGFGSISNGANSRGALFALGKTRGTDVGGVTSVVNGDVLGAISFNGADGTALINAATIMASVDGTPGTDDMPGRLVFSTTADGAAMPTERMRIDSAGKITLGGATATGVFNIPDHTTAANGLYIGSDVTLYRSAANVLKTDDAFVATGGVDSGGTGAYVKRKIVNLGDWNMDSTAILAVPHGLTLANIRNVRVLIINDAATSVYDLCSPFSGGQVGGYIDYIDATNVNIGRSNAPGYFDSANFDSTSYNRGYIVIEYV